MVKKLLFLLVCLSCLELQVQAKSVQNLKEIHSKFSLHDIKHISQMVEQLSDEDLAMIKQILSEKVEGDLLEILPVLFGVGLLVAGCFVCCYLGQDMIIMIDI